VEATVNASADVGAITLVSVASNEPDDGLGDGDTANDIVIVDDFTFKLRAERSANQVLGDRLGLESHVAGNPATEVPECSLLRRSSRSTWITDQGRWRGPAKP
jgi:hypothetical protein